MVKKSLLLILLITSQLLAQTDTLRIASYNLLNFPADNGQARLDAFRTVMEAMSPDLLVCLEVGSENGAELFRQNALDPDSFSRADFHDGPDTDNMLYYRTSAFELTETTYIATDLRDITVWALRRRGDEQGALLRVATAHLKSSTGGANEDRRLAEADSFITHEGDIYREGFGVICGDFNLYRSAEPAYQALLSDSLFYDPINTPGVWHDEAQFTATHTQSTRVEQVGGGASGGLDDRFDFILTSRQFNRQGDWSVIPDSYHAYGNDGQHFNQSINAGENQAVSADVANALYNASDHLPVVLDMVYRRHEAAEYRLVLQQGWNLISAPVQPVSAAMPVVWSEIVARGNLDVVKGADGRFYSPSQRFNNMNDWDARYGYSVKVQQPDTLIIRGQSLADTTVIPLREIWSFVSYLPEVELRAPDAFANIRDSLLLARDGSARFYAPRQGFSNMGLMSRGQGYQLRATQNMDLQWNNRGRR